jgi:hypothetical protein
MADSQLDFYGYDGPIHERPSLSRWAWYRHIKVGVWENNLCFREYRTP